MLKSRHHKAAGSADQLQQKTRTAEPQKQSGTNKEMLPNQKKNQSRNSFKYHTLNKAFSSFNPNHFYLLSPCRIIVQLPQYTSF